jgi:hypothetical protein
MLNNSKLYLMAALCATSLLSGCATLIGSTQQQVHVQTTDKQGKPINGVKCRVSNDKGTWYVTTPGKVNVHKSAGNLQVVSEKSGHYGLLSIPSKANSGLMGNMFFAGFVGAAIDHSKGTGYNYPQNVTLVLDQVNIIYK